MSYAEKVVRLRLDSAAECHGGGGRKCGERQFGCHIFILSAAQNSRSF